jgi:uncharacterized protein (DUF433 family)
MDGVAVFVGSRLPVTTLLASVDAGHSWERIVASWPWLTLTHLDAARAWAATRSSGAGGTAPTVPVDVARLRRLEQLRVLYLGISGVLHPSASTYELVCGRSPWDDSHRRYEAVPWLSSILAAWPDVRIVLSSTQPWKHGLQQVLEHLGVLAERVIGFTYEDLTKNAVRTVRTRSGTTRKVALSNEDYWRLNKSDVVVAHVEWLEPAAWVAVDDEDILWPRKFAEQVCIIDGCEGLAHPAEQDKLLVCLQMNFGPNDAR